MGLLSLHKVKPIGILLENGGVMGFDGTIIAFENCPFIYGLIWFYRDYNGIIMGEYWKSDGYTTRFMAIYEFKH